MEDRLYNDILNFKLYGQKPEEYPSTKSNFLAQCSKFSVRNSHLTRNGKWVVKSGERKEIFDAFHFHSGRQKSTQRISEKYWWYGLEKYVRQAVKECVACTFKNHRAWVHDISPLKPIKTEPKVMWRLHLDMGGPIRQSNAGNKYFVLAVDTFSKYVEGRRNFNFL